MPSAECAMKSKREFVEDVFSPDPEHGTELLGKTLEYAGRRKRRRALVRGATLAAVVCGAWLIAFPPQRDGGRGEVAERPEVAAPGPRVVPGTRIQLVTDEELLTLFAGRPVALVGTGNQRQFVVLDTFREQTGERMN